MKKSKVIAISIIAFLLIAIGGFCFMIFLKKAQVQKLNNAPIAEEQGDKFFEIKDPDQDQTDEEGIRSAFMKRSPHWKFFETAIEEKSSTHAIGTITWDKNESGNTHWFAAKDGNAWEIVDYGPGYFGTCQQFQKYEFPKAMTPDCWDADKKIIVNTSNPERFYNGLTVNDKEEIIEAFLTFMGPNSQFQDADLYVKYDENIGGYLRAAILIGGQERVSVPQIFAAKRNGEWRVLYYGQEDPSCSDIEGYDFPVSMISQCWGEGDWVQR